MLKGEQFVYNPLTTCLLISFILLRPSSVELVATLPLPSNEGCRLSNADVNGFRAGLWVGGR
jgi:hypothetical protein